VDTAETNAPLEHVRGSAHATGRSGAPIEGCVDRSGHAARGTRNTVHHGRVTVRLSATAPRARVLLLSVLSIGVLLFGIVAMHAHLAGGHTPIRDGMASSAVASHDAAMHAIPTDAPVTAAVMDVMQHGMGGMSAMDCLLLGMLCLFGMAALMLFIALFAQVRSLLRRRRAVRAPAADGRLRPPEPPSLLVLSVCRT
jgi:hypothetical protein